MSKQFNRIRNWFTITRIVGLLLGLLGLTVAIIGTRLDETSNTALDVIKEFYANGGSELISIAITVLVIDALNERRTTKQEQAALTLQMGSPDNAFAREAVRMLEARGWLDDGTLRGAYLTEANLQDAHLAQADLRDATMRDTNLKEAYLGFANLSGAFLYGANLSGANLDEADLTGAAFATVFRQATFDAKTTLPDNSKWTPETAVDRFTDAQHPDYWRSDDPQSPAYAPDAKQSR